MLGVFGSEQIKVCLVTIAGGELEPLGVQEVVPGTGDGDCVIRRARLGWGDKYAVSAR